MNGSLKIIEYELNGRNLGYSHTHKVIVSPGNTIAFFFFFFLLESFCLPLLLVDDLAYEVRWFFTRLRGGETTIQVASIDRFGVVRKEVRNSSSDISVERKDTNTYALIIHGTQDR